VYANINEIHFQVGDEFLSWLDYKPTRGDEELLNLLVLDLFDDININTEAKASDKMSQPVNIRANSSKQRKAAHAQSNTRRSLHTSKLIERPILIQHTKLTAQSSLSNLAAPVSAKPTIFDTYYDLVKSIHWQISVRPISINFRVLHGNVSSEKLQLNLPQIDIKSSGTKCDLEEELVSSKLVELPCTYLRACEKTSNKLPWLVEFKNLNALIFTELTRSTEFLINNIDLNLLFAVKPKYHQYDNLLSSLAFYLHIDWVKKCDLNLRKSQIGFLILLVSKIVSTLNEFSSRIDYSELDTKYNINSNK
jgi:hypothetical protein